MREKEKEGGVNNCKNLTFLNCTNCHNWAEIVEKAILDKKHERLLWQLLGWLEKCVFLSEEWRKKVGKIFELERNEVGDKVREANELCSVFWNQWSVLYSVFMGNYYLQVVAWWSNVLRLSTKNLQKNFSNRFDLISHNNRSFYSNWFSIHSIGQLWAL